MPKRRADDIWEEKNMPSPALTEETAPLKSVKSKKSITKKQGNSNSRPLTKDGRCRHWTIVVYPESAPEDWRDRLKGLQWIESPLHDKDVNPDGTLKKPHWHILLVFTNKKSYEQIKEIADSINGASPQYVQNITGMVRYLAHLDNPEKAQYDKSKIVGHGVDVSQYLESNGNIDELLQAIEIYCEENHIIEYAHLTRISRQFDEWHKCVSTHTIHFKAFVNSLRHSENQTIKDVSVKSLVANMLKEQEAKE